ncbi:MAG: four helix bundle protein [Ignavibacteriales bacterium]|nr:four helix bundle protein [Ignavibacteriales bacterium]
MKYDLEERLTNFAVRIIDIVESLPRTRTGNYLAGQLIRSGTSPALNYGEAQGAESRQDFIHKMKIIVKELRETRINLTIIHRKKLSRSQNAFPEIADECRQLISIFVKSIKTAESRKR